MGLATPVSPAPHIDVGRCGAATLAKSIFHARITHVRFTPKPYVLSHRLWYLAVRLSDLHRLNRFMLGYNRRRLFSLSDSDYGRGKQSLEEWLRKVFEEAGTALPGGEVVLVTLPRVLGIGFNPVSFWLCHDTAGQLIAVVAEVNNTFGERHCYLARNRDGSVITRRDTLRAEKVFYVSPFLPVSGEYNFRFDEQGEKLSIRIDVMRDGARVMCASISGHFSPLSNRALAVCFFRYPMPAVQVIGFIRYHAVRLYMQGVSIFAKPAPPDAIVSREFGSNSTMRGERHP
jgi:DUF1365 family protein